LDDCALKPFHASRFEVVKKLYEMAMFMEALRKLSESIEKMKRKDSDPT
jgi:hypothetical protein